jgi:hypothetical protein
VQLVVVALCADVCIGVLVQFGIFPPTVSAGLPGGLVHLSSPQYCPLWAVSQVLELGAQEQEWEEVEVQLAAVVLHADVYINGPVQVGVLLPAVSAGLPDRLVHPSSPQYCPQCTVSWVLGR